VNIVDTLATNFKIAKEFFNLKKKLWTQKDLIMSWFKLKIVGK
jgi:hypothetical protein